MLEEEIKQFECLKKECEKWKKRAAAYSDILYRMNFPFDFKELNEHFPEVFSDNDDEEESDDD